MPPLKKVKTDKTASKDAKDALYARCLLEGPNKRFTTNDLLDLGVIRRNDHDLLMECTQSLLKEGLFQASDSALGATFKVVKKEDAARFQNFTQDEDIVYSTIEASGLEGIWVRNVNLRTNLHSSVVLRCIKSLESKGFIKSVKSVKFPTRKMYMLASLSPTEEVTGGPWFTDGELDVEFVAELSDLVERYIRSKSFQFIQRSSQLLPKETSNATADGKRKKRKYETLELQSSGATTAAAAADKDGESGDVKAGSTPSPQIPPPLPNWKPRITEESERTTLHPYPPSHDEYLTAAEITDWINGSNVTDVPLVEEHLKQVLDLLYYDNRIERLPGRHPSTVTTYRAVKRPPIPPHPLYPGVGNAYTEAPCGRCPVFNLCEEKGPVSASSCVYFKDWLEKSSATHPMFVLDKGLVW